jgi:hypothetical protein
VAQHGVADGGLGAGANAAAGCEHLGVGERARVFVVVPILGGREVVAPVS